MSMGGTYLAINRGALGLKKSGCQMFLNQDFGFSMWGSVLRKIMGCCDFISLEAIFVVLSFFTYLRERRE